MAQPPHDPNQSFPNDPNGQGSQNYPQQGSGPAPQEPSPAPVVGQPGQEAPHSQPGAGYPQQGYSQPNNAGNPYTHQAPGYGGQGAGQPGAPYGYDPVSGLPYSEKSKLAAGLLGIFVGGFGVGRFYTGHVGLGVAQLIVTVVTFGFGSLWGLIDGILMLAGNSKDANGLPLRPN